MRHIGRGAEIQLEHLNAVLAELEPHLRSRTGIDTYITPLFRLRSDLDEIAVGPGLWIRRLTPQELERWVNPSWTLYDLPIDADAVLSLQVAIVSNIQGGGDDTRIEQRRRRHTDDLVTATRLITDAAVLTAFTDRWSGGPLRKGGGRAYNHVANQYATPGHLTAAHVEPLQELWRRLQKSRNRHVVDVALRRWDSGIGRTNDEDKLIDYWVALESLFSADSTSEIRFRAALRIAAFSGTTPEHRDRLYSRMRNSYDWRSALVHGAPPERFKTLAKEGGLTLMGVEAATRSTLRAALLAILALPGAFTLDGIEREVLRTSAHPGPVPPAYADPLF